MMQDRLWAESAAMRHLPRAALALALALILVGLGIRYVRPQIALSIALDVERSRAGLVERHARLAGGRVAYLEGGRGDTLVLLHAFGADKDTFLPLAKLLVPNFHLVVLDLPGFGDSAAPADADYSAAAQAERVHEFCRVLDIAPTNIGGSAMGAQIALVLAALHPHDVQSLWLLDPTGVSSATESELGRTLRATGPNPLAFADEAGYADFISFVALRPPPALPGFLQATWARSHLRSRAAQERILAQLAEPIEPRITGLKTPALIVFGADDRVVDARAAATLRHLLPKSHVVVMHDAGHWSASDQPDLAADDFRRFHDSM